MRRRTLHAPHPFGDINVTPLIDVVMCLIVFYLIVGRLASEDRARLALPRSAAGSSEVAAATLIISVLPGEAPSPTPRLLLGAGDVTEDRLIATLRDALAANPGLTVQIRAGRDLPYSSISPVFRLCREAGVASVRLATERAP